MTVQSANSLSRIALIGFGEVGQMIARELSSSGAIQIEAFDIAFADETSPQRVAARSLPINAAASAAEAVQSAQLVISAVTASSVLDAARSVAMDLADGAFFLDLNSVAPGTKRDAAAMISGGRGRYVEGAVMSPVYPKRLGTPILLGGPHASDFVEGAQAVGFNTSVFSDQIGSASAVKMCRSVVIKGLEAITMECLLAARRAGVEEDVLASLRESFPTLDWTAMAEYNLERMTTHGIRRSAEMHEVAKTVRELGIAPLMATATAAHEQTMGELRLKERCGGSVPEGLAAALDAVMEAKPWPGA